MVSWAAVVASILAGVAVLAMLAWMMTREPPAPFRGALAVRHILTVLAFVLVAGAGLRDPLCEDTCRCALGAGLLFAVFLVVVVIDQRKGAIAMTERQEQILLFMWARTYEGRLPELRLLFHVPNGGWRHKATAARLKAMGAKAGVLDVCLPVPRGVYHGLWIEMKHGSNKPTRKQWEWIHELRALGHQVEVCCSASEAERVILEYLGEPVDDGERW